MSAFREVMETQAALVGGIGVESRATIPQSGKDVTDSPARHRALQQSSLGHPGQRHVDRIRRRAHDLEPGVHAISLLCSYVRVSRGGGDAWLQAATRRWG